MFEIKGNYARTERKREREVIRIYRGRTEDNTSTKLVTIYKPHNKNNWGGQ
jgi:hypothetical protein